MWGDAQISFPMFAHYCRLLAGVSLKHLHCADTCLCVEFEVGAMGSADKNVSSVVATKLLRHILLTQSLLKEVALPQGLISLLCHKQ